MKFSVSIYLSKLVLPLLLISTTTLRGNCENSSSPPSPPESNVVQVTNRYHLTFTWDALTNATGYAVIVRSDTVETQRVWTATNFITVSNLLDGLRGYSFTAIATNQAGESAETPPAITRWMTVCESDSLAGPWILLATNNFAPVLPQHFIALSNWDASSLLKKD